jgi:hypothetical protein
MATLYTLLIGFVGGVVGAVVTDFGWKPFRQFFTLRTEIRHEMLRLAAASCQPYDGRMAGAVRAVALREAPVSDGSNSFYIQPASVAQVRKFLFGLLGGSPQEAVLARSCLTAIDILRDEHGIAANDTRHPDVMSEIPWPPEAG